MFHRWFKGLKERSELRKVGHKLYISTVNQARTPLLFSKLGVPDTLDGRFDLVVLHVGLVFRRLRSSGLQGKKMSEVVFSVMFDDLDQSVREMGVGDIRVGKKVKAMARAFYGRCLAYDQALDSKNQSELVKALLKNVYGSENTMGYEVNCLAAYVANVANELSVQSDHLILSGKISFPKVEEIIEKHD